MYVFILFEIIHHIVVQISNNRDVRQLHFETYKREILKT
jgi:hypothetical protein